MRSSFCPRTCGWTRPWPPAYRPSSPMAEPCSQPTGRACWPARRKPGWTATACITPACRLSPRPTWCPRSISPATSPLTRMPCMKALPNGAPNRRQQPWPCWANRSSSAVPNTIRAICKLPLITPLRTRPWRGVVGWRWWLSLWGKAITTRDSGFIARPFKKRSVKYGPYL